MGASATDKSFFRGVRQLSGYVLWHGVKIMKLFKDAGETYETIRNRKKIKKEIGQVSLCPYIGGYVYSSFFGNVK